VPSDSIVSGWRKGFRMTIIFLRMSSGSPSLDDKRCRMTIICLCMPSDSIVSGWRKSVQMTIICLRMSSGSPPLDDKRCKMNIICLCVPSDSIVSGWRKGVRITIICLRMSRDLRVRLWGGRQKRGFCSYVSLICDEELRPT